MQYEIVNIGACEALIPTIPNFIAARRRLVRPDEAAPVAEEVIEIQRVTGWAFGDALALWMRLALRSGLLRYIDDPPGPYDYWCSPRSVLERGGDDCDGLAILCASAVQAVGLPAMMRAGTLGGVGHAWAEGADEDGFFLLEATRGWLYRERPREYRPIGWVRLA